MRLLPETDEHLQAIFQAFPDLLLVLDREGKLLDYKSGGADLLVQPPGQLLGRRIQEVLPPEFSARFEQTVRYLHTNQTVSFDYQETLAGRQLWLEARLIMLSQDRLAAFIRDITARKQSELGVRRQLERMAALRAIDMAITSSPDLDLTLSILVHQVRTQLKVDAASILLMDARATSLKYAAGDGFRTSSLQNISLKAGMGFAGRGAVTGEPANTPGLKPQRNDFLRSPEYVGEGFVDYLSIPLIAKTRMLGILEIFQRSQLFPEPDWMDFMNMLAGQAAIAIDSAVLFHEYERSNAALTLAYDATIEGWSRALELRDRETQGHTRRVTEMVTRLAALLGMTQQQTLQIRRGAALHDIGKMAIPDHILFKPGPLDSDEWEIMRRHPSIALELLKPIHYLKEALDIPQYHHERWNGTGYPHGLREGQIPISARMFAAVDVYDALTSNRPYREAWSHADAMAYIRGESGRHFDPRVVEAFTGLMAEPMSW